MGSKIIKLTVLALAGFSLLPIAALPVTAEGSKGKEQPETEPPAPEPPVPEPEPPVPEPEVPEDLTERDGPPRNKPPRVPTKTTRTVVVGKSSAGPFYSYRAGANYCPAGLEPVSIAGEVSCGTPNQPRTYQQMLAHPKPAAPRHPVAKRTTYGRSAVPLCGVGMKGCSDR